MKRYFRNPIFLFYLLVLYVVTQFSWWLYLIASLYNDIYSDPVLLRKKTMMLVGEGSVFVLILFGGVFMIRRAYEKEKQLNKLQENFLLSVSHELKTPISSIKLFLQTLQKRELPQEKKEEIYNQSLSEIKRLENMVSNLLITRSIENKNYYFNKEKFNLTELINEVVASHKETILKNHIIETNLSDLEIIGDKDSFVSIVSNLLQNAAKYSSQNSIIKIFLVKKTDDTVLIISDQGVGIPDDKKPFVFNRFYREENEMTRQSKGTGLGLFILKYLVENHHGRISLRDNEPSGLTVMISIPHYQPK